MTILVTGCMGFIGSNLVPVLLKSGHIVIGFDNLVNPSLNPTDRMKAESGEDWKNFKFFNIDIRDFSTMTTVLTSLRPDYIVHLAALGSVPRSFQNPGEVTFVNSMGFVNICQLASFLEVKRLVFASSSSVYGDDQNSIRVESSLGSPLSPYAVSKLQNELFARAWFQSGTTKFIGLRFFNVYGPGQNPENPFSAVIPQFLNSKQININGDGEVIRDFTYVSDVCDAIDCALFANGSPSPENGFYNVCTGHGTSLKTLARLCGDKKTVNFLAARPGDIKESIGAPFAAQLYLKFTACIDIEHGIELTKSYYESLGVQNDTKA